jgi:hypothetical protein
MRLYREILNFQKMIEDSLSTATLWRWFAALDGEKVILILN